MKLFLVLIILKLAAGFSSISYAATSMGKHDFTKADWSDGSGCKVCHIAHNPTYSSNTALLWNHEVNTSQTYTLYGTASIGKVGEKSLLCLCCHDGTIALDAFGGAVDDKKPLITGNALIGTDLSDDHPIHTVSYDSASTALEAKNSIDPLKLFNDYVECVSCHDPHTTAYGKFLRMPNANSALCLTCHKK